MAFRMQEKRGRQLADWIHVTVIEVGARLSLAFRLSLLRRSYA